jgi:hypothetical protein
MMAERHPKRRFLEEAGALHRHPDRVRAEPFRRHRFFDPLDKVQVKYEMLRACAVDGRSVVAVAHEFGFSRETYYTMLAAFEDFGVVGLADGKRGRPGPLKLTDEAVRWALELPVPASAAARLPNSWPTSWGSRCIDVRSSGCWHRPEKKTFEAGSARSWRGRADGAAERYERLRSYVLTPRAERPRVSPAQFDLRRFNRFGLLGLADAESRPTRARRRTFEVQVIAIGTADARDRWFRLCELLLGLVRGAEDATSGAVRAGVDRVAGEGADDPEPAGRHRAVR